MITVISGGQEVLQRFHRRPAASGASEIGGEISRHAGIDEIKPGVDVGRLRQASCGKGLFQDRQEFPLLKIFSGWVDMGTADWLKRTAAQR